jgi:lysophospholipase L1-like esterase
MPKGTILTSVSNQTLRMVGRVSLGGHKFRVRLSNAFGTQPVTIAAAHAALRKDEAAIDPKTDRPILFAGKPSVTVPPGVQIVSDAFDLDAPNLSRFAVSLFVERDSGTPTNSVSAAHTVTYVAPAPGNFIAAEDLKDAAVSPGYYWLAGIDVLAPADAGTIVALGDSLTDESGQPYEAQDWPSLLAARLLQDKRTRNLAVVNVGISGNRVLADGMGVSALARFERDVLAQPNVRWVILFEGINDIGMDSVTNASEITDGYRQLIAKAHDRGIRVIGCTQYPWQGAFAYRENREKIRVELNNWIRTSGAFDAVVDLEPALRDPANPMQIREDAHRGDHLHPSAIGYQLIAKAFNLALFQEPSKR